MCLKDYRYRYLNCKAYCYEKEQDPNTTAIFILNINHHLQAFVISDQIIASAAK